MEFWKEEGLECVVLVCEVLMEEVVEICKNMDIEIEVFIYGVMCIFYFGCCILFNYMLMWDVNCGGCF